MTPTSFYLGAHHPNWLASAGVPLFVSRRSLVDYRTLPRASAPWALDSGGFTELQMHGRWTVAPETYAADVRRFAAGVGGMVFAAPQDWMCEPIVIAGGTAGRVRFAGTRLSVLEHQRRTVENFLELRRLAPDVPWMPVLQGWTPGEYFDCLELYADAGVDLRDEPIVGVGSVCRRQNAIRASLILSDLASEGLRLHAFGFKIQGLELAAQYIASADSTAWSLNARKHPPLPGHTHSSCANCLEYALLWRQGALSAIGSES
jgi:hypothetical protein